MELKHRRLLTFYGLHLLYFPALVIALQGMHRLQARVIEWAGDGLPPWVFPLLNCLLAAALYVAMGYVAGWWLHRRCIGPIPVGDASWDRANPR